MKKNYEQLILFLGGNAGWNGDGKTIPVKLWITKLDNKEKKIVLEKEYCTKRVKGVRGKSILRTLTAIDLEPGKYKIKIENKKDFQELSNVRVLLKVCYYGPK